MNSSFSPETENKICENCESKDENPVKELASKLNDQNEDVLGKIHELNLKNISISKRNDSLKNNIDKAGEVFEDTKAGTIFEASKFKGMPIS